LQPVTSFARGFDPGFPVFLYCHIEYGKTKWPGSSKIGFMNPHLPSDGVWFPNWAVVLAKVRLKDLDRRAYRLAIVGYLTFCKRARQRATVTSARLFMAEMESQRRLSRSQLTVWKAALNWFFTAAEVLDKRSYAVAGSGGFYIFGAVPTQPILATAITINGKALGSDGIMYRKLADNITVDVTPRVKNKDFYTFYVGASKHTLTSYTLHPALTDPNRERTQVGVGEEVSVYLDPPLDMTFPENPWWTAAGGGIDATDGSATTFTAASNACTATVTVHVRDVQLAKSFGVLEPSKPTAEITSTTGQRIPGAFPGAWMHLKLTLQPTSVSFYRVETIELECPASGITKYFTNHSPLSHGPAQFAGVWHGTDENNMITGGMDNCFYYDGENGIILMPTTGTDWYPGGEFIWDIQARWRILNTPSTEISLSWSAQHFKLDSNGTMTIDKFGQSVQRTIYDIITPTLP
jgi:hypothetical protein